MIKINYTNTSEEMVQPGQVLSDGNATIMVIHDEHGYNAIILDIPDGEGVPFDTVYEEPVSLEDIEGGFPVKVKAELNLKYDGRL